MNRAILIAMILIVAALPSRAAYALVQHGFKLSTDSNTAVTTAASYSTATFLVLECVIHTGFTPTVSDSSSNTWRLISSVPNTSSTANMTFWYVTNPIVSASQTFTCTSTGHFPAVFVEGFSGTSSGAPLIDVQNSSTTVPATCPSSIQPGSITPNANNELVVSSWAGSDDTLTGIGIDSSFTITDSSPGSANAYGGGLAYIVQTSAAATNPTWSWTAGSGTNCVNAQITSFTFPPSSGYILTQYESEPSQDDNTATTPAANYTGTNLIVIGCNTSNNGGTPPSISDSSSNTWNVARTDDNGSNAATTIWYSYNPTVTTSQTFTCSLTGKFPAIFVQAFSGGTSSPVDQQHGAPYTGSTTANPGSITPTQNNELVVTTFWSGSGGVTSMSISSPYAITSTGFTPPPASSWGGGMAFAVQGTATATNPTWTINIADTAISDIVSFKPPSASNPINHPLGVF